MKIFAEDINEIGSADFIPWERLSGKTVLVTGATGLIGRTLVYGLNFANKQHSLNMHVVALVRNQARAEERFREILPDGMLSLKVGSVENLPAIDEQIDFIVHGASQTASREFVTHPVETL